MRTIPGNAQHIGSRKEQQDDFGFSDIDNATFVNHGGVLAVIADGMGGLARGREASLIAKQTMLQEYDRKSERKTIPQALVRALSVANAKVVALARQSGLEGQIGTTLAAAAVKDAEMYWVSVGDSRIYLYRRGELTQLTTDHDYARELAREAALGNISPEEAATHPQRQALTSYLGLPFLSEIDRNEEPVILETGDRILLCSDGLYKTLPEQEIIKLLDGEPQKAADNLVEATLAKGKSTQDNVTVAILACEPEEIGFFRCWFANTALYAKGLIIILMLCGLGGAAYFIPSYFISPKTQTKAEVGAPLVPIGAEPALQDQIWTPLRKVDVVLRLLRGEPIELLSRELGLEPSGLEKWRETALAGMAEALKTSDPDSLQAELAQTRRRLEELTNENKSLKAQIKKQRSRGKRGTKDARPSSGLSRD